MIDISVIVPVYKVDSKYLRECIDSILKQSLSEFELILVDDGAPAENSTVLDEYADKDDRIIVLHGANQGVSMARNRGLAVAKGRYITYVDSDDTITEDNLEKAVAYADKNDLDVLMWGINLCYPDRQKKFIPYCKNIDLFDDNKKREVMMKCLVGILPFFECPPATNDAAGSACAKLYRREFLTENNLLYTKGLKRAEDMTFNLKAFDAAKRIGSLNEFFYNYRQLSESATYVYRDGGIDVFTDSLREIKSYLDKTGKDDLFIQVYYMRCMFFFLESMDMDYLNKENSKPLRVRLNQMRMVSQSEPYKEAFDNLKGEHLTFARKIPLFLIKRGWMFMLAAFYKVYRLILA